MWQLSYTFGLQIINKEPIYFEKLVGYFSDTLFQRNHLILQIV